MPRINPTPGIYLGGGGDLNQFGNGSAEKAVKPPSGIDFETTNPDGSSFSEFTFQLDND